MYRYTQSSIIHRVGQNKLHWWCTQSVKHGANTAKLDLSIETFIARNWKVLSNETNKRSSEEFMILKRKIDSGCNYLTPFWGKNKRTRRIMSGLATQQDGQNFAEQHQI